MPPTEPSATRPRTVIAAKATRSEYERRATGRLSRRPLIARIRSAEGLGRAERRPLSISELLLRRKRILGGSLRTACGCGRRTPSPLLLPRRQNPYRSIQPAEESPAGPI